MKTLKPLGARVYVEDIVTTLSIEERAQRAGFVAIVNEENRPKATQGRVVAIGTDPFIQEHIVVGDVVFFSSLAGTRIYVAERELRCLEFNELTGVEHEESTSNTDATCFDK
jgi:co-chaperonin GroES (HSP10)